MEKEIENTVEGDKIWNSIYTKYMKSLLVLQKFIRSSLKHEKAVPCFRHTEKLIFVQHSSEYETSLSDISYSDECWTKMSFSVCLKHGTAFSCFSEDLVNFCSTNRLFA